MIFNPKEELLPTVSVAASSTSNHVPYYTPSQPEKSSLVAQQTPVQQVSPEQDKKIQQLEVVSHAAPKFM